MSNKTSVWMAGFLNGFNFFSLSCHHSKISDTLGSLKSNIEFSNSNGFQHDANMLFGDWVKVRKDIMTAYYSATKCDKKQH